MRTPAPRRPPLGAARLRRPALATLLTLATGSLLLTMGASPTSAAADYSDHQPPGVSVALAPFSRTSLRHFGVQVTVTVNEPGSLNVIVRDPHRREISAPGGAVASMPEGGSTTVAVLLSQGAKAKLRRGRAIRWSVVSTATDGVGNRTGVATRLWLNPPPRKPAAKKSAKKSS
jgi:hypothetical protein